MKGSIAGDFYGQKFNTTFKFVSSGQMAVGAVRYIHAVEPVCSDVLYLVQLKVQWYSPGCANVLIQLIHCSLSPLESAI